MICTAPNQIIGVQSETPLAWSDCGTALAFVSGNKSIVVCGPQTGSTVPIELRVLLVGHRHQVRCLSFHPRYPDVPHLVSGGDDGVLVWDVDKACLIQQICSTPDTTQKTAHESTVLSCCWAFGEVLITGSKDTNIKIWDANKGYCLLETIFGHKAPVLALSFSATSRILASAGRDSTIKLWDMSSLSPELVAHRDDDKSINVALIANMDGHRGDVVCLTFNDKDQTLFSGARDNDIKVWDVKEHKEIRQVNNKDNGHIGDVRRLLVINRGAYLLSAGLDGKIKLWKIAEKNQSDAPLISLDDLDSKDIDLESKALEEILRGGPDVELEAVAQADELQMTMAAHAEDCYEMEINPKSPLLCTSSSYNTVRIWKIDDLTSPKLVFEFVGHTEAVTKLTMLKADSQLLSGSTDYKVHLYDLRSSRRKACFDFGGSVLSVAVTPDEAQAYVGGNDYEIKGYQLAEDNYTQMVKLVAHSGRVVALAITPDGETLASGGHDFNICVWHLRKAYDPPLRDAVTQRMTVPALKPYARVEAHRGHVLHLEFSTELGRGVFLASAGNDHALKVWNVRQGGRLTGTWKALDAHDSAVSCATFGRGASATYIYSCGWDAKIRVWEVMPTKLDQASQAPLPVQTMTGHEGRVEAVQTTRDGGRLISISLDYTALLWEATDTFACLCMYRPIERMGQMTALGVGDRHFVTGSDSGVIRVWPLFGIPEHDASFQPFDLRTKKGAVEAREGSVIHRGMSFTTTAEGGSDSAKGVGESKITDGTQASSSTKRRVASDQADPMLRSVELQAAV